MVVPVGKDFTSLATEGQTGPNLGGERLKKRKLNCNSFNKAYNWNCSHEDISAVVGSRSSRGSG